MKKWLLNIVNWYLKMRKSGVLFESFKIGENNSLTVTVRIVDKTKMSKTKINNINQWFLEKFPKDELIIKP